MNNNKSLHVLGSILVGLLFGYIIWGHAFSSEKDHDMGTHQMPNGEMMSDMPMDMDSMMAGMMAGLQGKTGDEFDKEFLSEMIVHHQGAVEMAQMVLNTSKRPELINLANGIISAQNGEIKQMQDWQKAWFK